MANVRQSNIPMECYDNDGNILHDTNEVLEQWKNDYHKCFNGEIDTNYLKNDHLESVKACLTDYNNTMFPKPDCSSLNAPITRDEIRKSVYDMKLGKAMGCDGIPSEVLRNDCCIDLLYKIIKFSFEKGLVPGDWLKSLINPIPNNDSRDPLSFRPITLISIPCKIYTKIINKRLSKWLEVNKTICDEQNGFRKHRSCQDHIYIHCTRSYIIVKLPVKRLSHVLLTLGRPLIQ